MSARELLLLCTVRAVSIPRKDIVNDPLGGLVCDIYFINNQDSIIIIFFFSKLTLIVP